jgi:hypothetical protein
MTSSQRGALHPHCEDTSAPPGIRRADRPSSISVTECSRPRKPWCMKATQQIVAPEWLRRTGRREMKPTAHHRPTRIAWQNVSIAGVSAARCFDAHAESSDRPLVADATVSFTH